MRLFVVAMASERDYRTAAQAVAPLDDGSGRGDTVEHPHGFQGPRASSWLRRSVVRADYISGDDIPNHQRLDGTGDYPAQRGGDTGGQIAEEPRVLVHHRTEREPLRELLDVPFAHGRAKCRVRVQAENAFRERACCRRVGRGSR